MSFLAIQENFIQFDDEKIRFEPKRKSGMAGSSCEGESIVQLTTAELFRVLNDCYQGLGFTRLQIVAGTDVLLDGVIKIDSVTDDTIEFHFRNGRSKSLTSLGKKAYGE